MSTTAAAPAAPAKKPETSGETDKHLDPTPYLAPKSPPPGPSPFPKHLWHAVHGEIVVKDAEEEGRVLDRQSWFNTPEEADAHRSADEAWLVQAASLAAKLHSFAAHKPEARVVTESNQAMAAAAMAKAANEAATVTPFGGTSAGTPGSTTGHTGVAGATGATGPQAA